MTIRSILKSAVLGAGLCIFAIGLAIAQTAPSPGAPGAERGDRRAIAEACRAKIGTNLQGPERREAMKKCVQESRGANGGNDREARRAKNREIGKACREELKNERFTEAERRAAMQACAAKKDPALGKQHACRNDAEAKKLERGTKEFRQFMRECNGRT